MGSHHHKHKLPHAVHHHAERIFEQIDQNNSGKIDRYETFKYLSGSFSNLNSEELFSEIDRNNSGKITRQEWFGFWTAVYNSGHTELEIENMLNNIEQNGSFIKYANAVTGQGVIGTNFNAPIIVPTESVVTSSVYVEPVVTSSVYVEPVVTSTTFVQGNNFNANVQPLNNNFNANIQPGFNQNFNNNII